MRERRWMMVTMLAAVVVVPLALHGWGVGDAARAEIICPVELSKITPISGTLRAIRVVRDAGGAQMRHHQLFIDGTCNSSGAFEVIVPHVNGFVRLILLKETDSAMGSATLDVSCILDNDLTSPTLETPIVAQGTMAGSPNQLVLGAFTTDALTYGTSCNSVAGAVRVKLASATAGGKFRFMMMVRVGA